MQHPYVWNNGWSYDTQANGVHYYDEHGLERCGANIGTEERPRPCRNFPIVGKVRCHLHMERSLTSRNTPGTYLSQAFPPSEQLAIQQALDPLNRDISADVAILEYRKLQLVRRIFSNEQVDISALLEHHINLGAALSRADFPNAYKEWQAMDIVLRTMADDDKAWEGVYDLIERKRKTIQTESTALANSAKIITYEKVSVVLTQLMHSILEINNYNDPNYRRREFERSVREMIDRL